MGARSILATLVSLLLIYVPIAPAASPAVVGKVMTKGQALVNGTLVPAEATVFAGDRLSTEKDTASGISLPGGDQVFLPAVSAAQFNSVGRQITVALERGALAVVNRSPQPVIVEANGVHIQGGSAISVYEVAIAGNTLKVMARKGMATVKASNRTVEVKEGTTLDASTRRQRQSGRVAWAHCGRLCW